MTREPLFGWLQALYPLWRRLDEESSFVSAWVGLAELALSGCTTSSDHLYLHPKGGGDLLSAEIAELGAAGVGVAHCPSSNLILASGIAPVVSLRRDGEIGVLAVGAVADLAVWDLTGIQFAGAIADPIEAWLRCGPAQARDTIVAGRHVVRDGRLVSPRLDEMLTWHHRLAAAMQAGT